MSVGAGTRLGPSVLLGLLGRGGVSGVCKARDTRLDPAVAIDFLTDESRAHPERRARFERDARAMVEQIGDALTAARRHGIAHRDLEPGNVMLTTGVARLALVRRSLGVDPAEEPASVGLSTMAAVTHGGTRTYFARTPDGTARVFVSLHPGVQQRFVRRLDTTEAAPPPGTQGAHLPAACADGQWVALWSSGRRERMA